MSAKEVILMIGYPGSGKTTYAKSLSNYHRVDGDQLKTAAAMKREAAKYIQSKSVIFDCLSSTVKKRAEFIEFAKKQGLPVRAIWMKTSMEESMRRNKEREAPVPNVVFYVYKKNFVPPSLEEGFCEIKLIE